VYNIIESNISLKLDALGYISIPKNGRLYFQPLLRNAFLELPRSAK